MELNDLLTRERVIAALAVPDKAALLAELGRRAGAAVGIPAARITEALENRERLGSTGLGGGFALPHARVDGLEKFFGMCVRLARPIPFDAVDDLPVSLVFLLLSREVAGNDHLAAVAAISRRMGEPELARRLRSLSSAAELFSALTGEDGKRAA